MPDDFGDGAVIITDGYVTSLIADLGESFPLVSGRLNTEEPRLQVA